MAQGLDDRAARGPDSSSCWREVRLGSVVSTFLVSFGVVAATIAGVLYVAINAPDQPATIRRQPDRAERRRKERAAASAERKQRAVASGGPSLPTVAMAATPALALPDSDIMRLRVLPAGRTTLWVRIRSGVALVVLVGVLGALLAMAIGGAVLGSAFLIRSATG
jgi:hypothetical protein